MDAELTEFTEPQSPAAPPNPSTAETSTADPSTDWHRPLLREVAELSMGLLRRVHRQAEAAADADPAQDPATTAPGMLFASLARAIRHTVALDAKLAADARTPPAAREAQSRLTTLARQRRRATIHQIRQKLRECVEADTSLRETDYLLEDLDDRLASPAMDDAIATNSVIQVVCTLCAEFGIALNCSSWTDEELGYPGDGDLGENPYADPDEAPPWRPT